MGKKSKRNRDVSKKQMSASLLELVEKGDYEGILKLESDAILRATVLEEREPQQASLIYLVIANAFVETGFSSMIAREKAIHCLERTFALSEKEMVHDCVKVLVPFCIQEGRNDEVFATVKKIIGSIPQYKLIDLDLIIFIAQAFSQSFFV